MIDEAEYFEIPDLVDAIRHKLKQDKPGATAAVINPDSSREEKLDQLIQLIAEDREKTIENIEQQKKLLEKKEIEVDLLQKIVGKKEEEIKKFKELLEQKKEMMLYLVEKMGTF